jgi:Uri superfamily endonuclease
VNRPPPSVPPGDRPGTYLLRFDLSAAVDLEVGRLETVRLTRGTHFYVGSAFGPGGVAARVRRHVLGDGRPHWHVDRLRAQAPVRACWYAHATRDLEHRWAMALQALPGASISAPGFGASDCGCASHLLRFGRAPSAVKLLTLLGICYWRPEI